MPPDRLHRVEQGLRASLHPIDSGIGEEVAVSYSAEANAIFAAFTTPPTTARKGLINTCVNSLVSTGVWAKLDALYMYAAADAQASLINWKAPGTFNCTAVNAPTFTADNGYTGASTKYLDSGFNPSTASTPKYVRDSACAFGWALTDVNVAAGLVGFPTTQNLQIIPHTGSSTTYMINQSAAHTATYTSGLGLWNVNRSGASALQLYRNGASFATNTGASIAVVNENIVFLRRTSAYWTGQLACGGFGQSLDATNNTDLYNATHTYLQTVAGIA